MLALSFYVTMHACVCARVCVCVRMHTNNMFEIVDCKRHTPERNPNELKTVYIQCLIPQYHPSSHSIVSLFLCVSVVFSQFDFCAMLGSGALLPNRKIRSLFSFDLQRKIKPLIRNVLLVQWNCGKPWQRPTWIPPFHYYYISPHRFGCILRMQTLTNISFFLSASSPSSFSASASRFFFSLLFVCEEEAV